MCIDVHNGHEYPFLGHETLLPIAESEKQDIIKKKQDRSFESFTQNALKLVPEHLSPCHKMLQEQQLLNKKHSF